jgi:hypothetical protein
MSLGSILPARSFTISMTHPTLPPPVTDQMILDCQEFFRMLGFDISYDDAETITIYLNSLVPLFKKRRLRRRGRRRRSRRE